MNQKDIVVKLIEENMRFRQYTIVLNKLGIDTSNFEPDLMDIVAKLLNVKTTDKWIDLYVSEINKCQYMSIEHMGENLAPLAEVCYHTLLSFNPD